MFRWLLIFLLIVAAAAGLAVGALNVDVVSLDFLVFELDLPLGGLVLLVFSSGLVAGLVLAWLLFFLPGRVRRSTRSRSNSKGNDLTSSPNG